MNFRFSDLCEKKVVNCSDGAIIGNVSDIEISHDDCKVTALFIDCNKGLLSKSEEIRIQWDKIQKIGIDVIIVDFCPTQLKEVRHEKIHKKFFFK